MRRVTGVWCPTCGMTRAVGWLAHGDLHQSLRYHPLAPLLLIQGAIAAVFLAVPPPSATGGPRSGWRPMSRLRGLLVANALLVLVVWAIRLKSGSFDDLG